MPANAGRSHRGNLRNNRYYSLLDEIAARHHYSAVGIAWRYRTELFLLAVVAVGVWRLTYLTNLTVSALVFGIDLIGFALLPWTRRRFWCVLVRHRIQRVCWEARLHTRSGRLPLILWTRPTQVGERLWLVCRAGICAEDFEQRQAELAAACYAREARITRNPRWSHLITLDIIRRDTLAATRHIPSSLPDRTRPDEAA